MKSVAYIPITLLLMLTWVCACKEKSKDPLPIMVHEYSNRIPDSLKNQVELTLGVACMERKDYSTTYWSFFDSTHNPQEAYTDINNDQQIDYAWVVTKDNQIRIAVALSNRNAYRYWLSPFHCEAKKPTGVNTSVSPFPAGRKDILRPTVKSLELKDNGFLIQLLEKEQYILFVNDSGFLQIFEM
jgi:hypothetical protein